jgi:hypothetical protein
LPETIRIAVPTLDVARRLAESLPECTARVADVDGAWFVEVECDSEFNALLLRVLDGTEAYLALNPGSPLELHVDGRSYPLHPSIDGNGARPAG